MSESGYIRTDVGYHLDQEKKKKRIDATINHLKNLNHYNYMIKDLSNELEVMEDKHRELISRDIDLTKEAEQIQKAVNSEEKIVAKRNELNFYKLLVGGLNVFLDTLDERDYKSVVDYFVNQKPLSVVRRERAQKIGEETLRLYLRDLCLKYEVLGAPNKKGVKIVL